MHERRQWVKVERDVYVGRRLIRSICCPEEPAVQHVPKRRAGVQLKRAAKIGLGLQPTALEPEDEQTLGDLDLGERWVQGHGALECLFCGRAACGVRDPPI